MKRVNLKFIQEGNVAVLRNGEQRVIKEFTSSNQIASFKIRFDDSLEWCQYYKLGDYYPCYSLNSPFDIKDVLHNGVSIF